MRLAVYGTYNEQNTTVLVGVPVNERSTARSYRINTLGQRRNDSEKHYAQFWEDAGLWDKYMYSTTVCGKYVWTGRRLRIYPRNNAVK